MAGHHRTAAPGQQAESIVEPRRDLLDREHLHPARRELDRERDPVQPVADLGHPRRVLVRHREARLDHAGPIDEEAHGLVLPERR
jgi:hypothetical protein